MLSVGVGKRREVEAAVFCHQDCCMLRHLMTVCALECCVQSFFEEHEGVTCYFLAEIHNCIASQGACYPPNQLLNLCITYFNDVSYFAQFVMWACVKSLVSPHLLDSYQQKPQREEKIGCMFLTQRKYKGSDLQKRQFFVLKNLFTLLGWSRSHIPGG